MQASSAKVSCSALLTFVNEEHYQKHVVINLCKISSKLSDDSLASIPVAFSDALISSYKVTSVKMNQHLSNCFLARQKSSKQSIREHYSMEG